MTMLGFQTTIASPVTISGTGVHSGVPVSITFNPAEADSGIVFQRQFADGTVSEYRAVSSQVGSTDLCTVLGFSPATSIATVEHVILGAAIQQIDMSMLS